MPSLFTIFATFKNKLVKGRLWWSQGTSNRLRFSGFTFHAWRSAKRRRCQARSLHRLANGEHTLLSDFITFLFPLRIQSFPDPSGLHCLVQAAQHNDFRERYREAPRRAIQLKRAWPIKDSFEMRSRAPPTLSPGKTPSIPCPVNAPIGWAV